MFTRAAKSVVKNLGQRKYYGGEDNLKVTMIGAAGEVGQTLSHFVKNASKLESSLVRDSNLGSRFLMLNSEKNRPSDTLKALKVQEPKIESYLETSQRKKSPTFVSCFANRELDLEKTMTELKDKEIKLAMEESIKREEAKSSSERSITRFSLAKGKTNGLDVLGRVSTTSAISPTFQSRQVERTTLTPINTQACEGCRIVCSDCRTEDPCDEDNPCNRKERKREKPVGRQGNPCKKGKIDPCREKKDDCPPVNRGPECPGK